MREGDKCPEKIIERINPKIATSKRYCPETQSWRSSESPLCDEFVLNEYVYCEHFAQWLIPKGCEIRRKQKANVCRSCRQGKIITKLVNDEIEYPKKQTRKPLKKRS